MNTTKKSTSKQENQEDSTNSNYELIKREEIPNSPFTVITTEEGSFGTMGKYRITEIKETEREIIEELDDMNWNRIVQIILILIETNK